MGRWKFVGLTIEPFTIWRTFRWFAGNRKIARHVGHKGRLTINVLGLGFEFIIPLNSKP